MNTPVFTGTFPPQQLTCADSSSGYPHKTINAALSTWILKKQLVLHSDTSSLQSSVCQIKFSFDLVPRKLLSYS